MEDAAGSPGFASALEDGSGVGRRTTGGSRTLAEGFEGTAVALGGRDNGGATVGDAIGFIGDPAAAAGVGPKLGGANPVN